ncbi:vWA domain-containing protein [Eilatimonas milleporae]|uniref:von Willebrand factor type A domain-containing protein n=1 Tax=Eilatimonas milleporae TaxID=911205 RepID=A0A3M0CT73_9PROT|nr:vWA domain-containing protein [Eilatimonas milleporae]RMB12668.1 von Willebrand factor type A domain-containing protein [Eilatimonas milleporae]
MAASRRTVNPIGMAFLDVMFCGFGAVVLLVMLLSGLAVTARKEAHIDLRGEVRSLERAVNSRERILDERSTALTAARAQESAIQTLIAATRADIRRLAAGDRGDPTAAADRVAALRQQLLRLNAEVEALRAAARESAARGDKVRTFVGDGERQYLSGLKVGGKRILILLDASASMLDRTIVNVIRLRNMAPEDRRRAAKWTHALRTTQWLLSNLPADSQFQIYIFDTTARPLLKDSAGQWLAASQDGIMDRIDTALGELAPQGGTSLHKAFAVVSSLLPRADNILLLTDGLPTQGANRPRRATVSGETRLKHFRRAVDRLGSAVPVNTILFPMEGDPVAAVAYWQLATRTKGSFLTPTADWP